MCLLSRSETDSNDYRQTEKAQEPEQEAAVPAYNEGAVPYGSRIIQRQPEGTILLVS